MVKIDIRKIRVNERIRTHEVQLIDDTGKRVGVKPIAEALRYSADKGLDLVEMVPNAVPPICKVMDFSKFKYDQEQKQKQERKKSKTGQVKEIRFRPNIGPHDFEFKLNHICEFLKEKYRVKVTVMYSGREMQHKEKGYELFERIKEKIAEIGSVVGAPNIERNRLFAMLAPKK